MGSLRIRGENQVCVRWVGEGVGKVVGEGECLLGLYTFGSN